MKDLNSKDFRNKKRKRSRYKPPRLLSIVVHAESLRLIEEIANRTTWSHPSIMHSALIAYARYKGVKDPPLPKIKKRRNRGGELTLLRDVVQELFERSERIHRKNAKR